MYNQARKLAEENTQLKNVVKTKNREIEEIKETAKREKEEFVEELNEMTENFKKNQEEFQKIMEVSENLTKKYESAVDQIEKMKKTKVADTKFVENFINSNDAIVKAFNAFKNVKKNGVLSLELKLKKETRSTSQDSLKN